MKRIALVWMVLTGSLLAPATGYAQVSCSREGLQRAVDLYVAAQTKGDVSGMPLAAGAAYIENIAPASIDKGLIRTAMKIDHHRSLLDPQPFDMLLRRFADSLGKGAMKMELGSAEAGSQRRETEIPLEIALDVEQQRQQSARTVVHGAD